MKPIVNIMQKLQMRRKHLAEALACNQSTIARWEYSTEKRGYNGNIPYKYHEKLKKIAEERGVKLTAEDFFNV